MGKKIVKIKKKELQLTTLKKKKKCTKKCKKKKRTAYSYGEVHNQQLF